jgi:hypothetical protein
MLGSGTPWGSAAYLGVGDGTGLTDVTMTGLQGSNILYKALSPGYPSYDVGTNPKRANLVWAASYGADEANFTWREYSVCTIADNAGINLNRYYAPMSYPKPPGEVWDIVLTIGITTYASY